MLIEIDLMKLRETADAAEEYLRMMKNCMKSADEEILALSLVWNGADYIVFRNRWTLIRGAGSAFAEWCRELEDYTSCLRFAGERYREVQQNARERADRLAQA